MPSWLKKGLSPHHTALAMVGAKAGDLVAIVGAHDAPLAAEIARVTALTGQTIVCDSEDGAAERVDAAAADAGALVEFAPAPPTALPFDAASRDIVVVLSPLAELDEASQSAIVAEAVRVLRPGGRIVIVDGERKGGLLGGFRRGRPRLPSDAALRLLDRAGTRARRQLADVDGVAFYEGRRE
ncbi:MAG: methyltransferase domain-containing protein [Acidobacteria bacterium]|nr:methyltransferase domain-containing protein [Acidobacteriota bacterium]